MSGAKKHWFPQDQWNEWKKEDEWIEGWDSVDDIPPWEEEEMEEGVWIVQVNLKEGDKENGRIEGVFSTEELALKSARKCMKNSGEVAHVKKYQVVSTFL